MSSEKGSKYIYAQESSSARENDPNTAMLSDFDWFLTYVSLFIGFLVSKRRGATAQNVSFLNLSRW